MPPIQDHPLRYQLANELHARPFPATSRGCASMALTSASAAAPRVPSSNLVMAAAARARPVTEVAKLGAEHPSIP